MPRQLSESLKVAVRFDQSRMIIMPMGPRNGLRNNCNPRRVPSCRLKWYRKGLV